jgi:hypothetical protein
MVGLVKRDEFERWLNNIGPAELGRQVAIVLAGRAALRVVPILISAFGPEPGQRGRLHSDLVLPAFRAAALVWVAAEYPARQRALAVAADHATEGGEAATSSAKEAAGGSAEAMAAFVAARAACLAVLANSAARAAFAVTYAMDAAIDFAAEALRATDIEAGAIANETPAAQLAAWPLWPFDAPPSVLDEWGRLKGMLLSANEGWEVWTDWYEARLAGDAAYPPNEALEVARATIPDEIWKQGPAAVNAAIKRLIDEHQQGELVVDEPTGNIVAADDGDLDQAAFTPILATRAALRVLPLLVNDRDRPGDTAKSKYVLAIFRALAVAWARTEYPSAVEPQLSIAAAEDVDTYNSDSSPIAHYVGGVATESAFASGSVAPRVAAHRASRVLIQAREAIRASAGDDATEVIVELANSNDVSDIGPGVRPDQIARAELWPGRDPPPFINAQWGALKEALRFANEGWDVWIDWYEARLDGRLRPQEVELSYVQFTRNLSPTATAWEANSEIKRLIGLQSQKPSVDPPSSKRLEIPSPKPAAVEPIFRGSRLTLAKKTADADMRGPTISAALKALAQTLGELAEDASEQSNIDKRFVARLQEIAQAVPKKRPTQTELFRLGHDYDELSAYSGTVADSWPELVAARYMAMTRAFERTLRRFPRWLDFTREPPIANISAQDARDISQAAQALSAVLRAPENLNVVDPVLPDALDRIAAPLDLAAQRHEARADPIELGMELLARDVLESVNNTFKLVAELALAAKLGAAKAAEFAGKKLGSYATQFGSHADKSLLKSSAQLGDKVGPAIVKLAKWSLRATIGGTVLQSQGPTVAAWLVQHYPQMFSWLEPFATFMH